MIAAAGQHSAQGLIRNFVKELDAAETLDSAMDVPLDAIQALGFRRVSYSYLPSPRLPDGRWSPLTATTRNYPAKWDEDWKRHGANCPYYHACFEGSAVLRWGRVRERRAQLQAAEKDCMGYLEDHELANGVTVPIHLPRRQFAFVTVLDSAPLTEFEYVFSGTHEQLYFVAHEFHDTTFRKFGGAFGAARPFDLSSREIECLAWAARGKTAEETAAIIDRSFETVRAHLKSSIVKLGATNRSHAIAKACWLGIIDAHG